ncbi:hypothetical protein HWV62_5492 [Athelia sp. TMB]|nr:hypothetical protein HWV62_5492 [Athelia sp. TMB]
MGLMLNPRSLTGKLVTLVALVTFMLAVYTYTSSTTSTFSLPKFSVFSKPRVRGSCAPQAWNAGHWEFNPAPTNLTQMTDRRDALQFAGFEGCASDREYFWHLASDTESQWDRWPAVTSWRWAPDAACDARPLNGAEMLRDMVEDGGWLLMGDSITEGHFFSLSCLLSPHVRATPNYTENPYFDRAWPQNLYLNPASPLIASFNLPAGFSIEHTPLVTFRRNDLLLSKDELIALHREKYPPNATFELFSEESFWSLSPQEYMALFTAPAPAGNYGTLIASTGGHWTTTLLHGFRDDAAGVDAGFGIAGVIGFFEHAMERWAREVQALLDADRRADPRPGRRPRRVVVRAYTPGHEDCKDHREPWRMYQPGRWKHYNWFWIKDYNQIFEKVLKSASFPDIFYLPIDNPALLRPDAHASGDCLHIMAGAGVLEGWSHYIWHFVSKELAGRIR